MVSAPDGQAGWELLQSRGHEFSLLVTDIEMPRMDGLELTRRLRRDRRVSHLPVLLLTSLAGDENMKRGYEAGATPHLTRQGVEVVCAQKRVCQFIPIRTITVHDDRRRVIERMSRARRPARR